MSQKDISNFLIVMKQTDKDIDILSSDGNWGLLWHNPDTKIVELEFYSPNLNDFFDKKPSHDDIFGDYMSASEITSYELGKGKLKKFEKEAIESFIGEEPVEICTIDMTKTKRGFVDIAGDLLFDKKIPVECKID